MLSFGTKESHVKWLLTTALAVTGSALERLLSDARRKKRNTIDKSFLEVSKSAPTSVLDQADLEILHAEIAGEAENHVNFIKS